MLDHTVSAAATGLPTSSVSHNHTTTGLMQLGVHMRPEFRHEVRGTLDALIPVAFRADPLKPSEAVAVFPYILPDNEPGTLAYTPEGMAIVSDEWLASSVPAKLVAVKKTATALRERAKCRLKTNAPLDAGSRAVAERRRETRSVSFPNAKHPFLTIGYAMALTAQMREADAAAMLLSQAVYGHPVGRIAVAFGLGWQDTYDRLEAAKELIQSDPAFAVDFAVAESLARKHRIAQDTSVPKATALAA